MCHGRQLCTNVSLLGVRKGYLRTYLLSINESRSRIPANRQAMGIRVILFYLDVRISIVLVYQLCHKCFRDILLIYLLVIFIFLCLKCLYLLFRPCFPSVSLTQNGGLKDHNNRIKQDVYLSLAR